MENFQNQLVVGISTRALFDMEEENKIYEEQGVKAYCEYQVAHENEPLKPGAGFALVKALLKLNEREGTERIAEVIIMSRNSADTGLRIFNSIRYYGLDITRAALVSGASLAPYLSAFNTDLFLSADEEDVQRAIDAGIAAGIICTGHVPDMDYGKEIDQIRIAFDGDAVIFSDELEMIFKEYGMDAFQENERENAEKLLPEGPFAKLLKTISTLQKKYEGEQLPIKTALVTSRNAPAHERVIRTLRAWDVKIEEAFFLGGIPKKEILKAFGAHIFFDDQAIHTEGASEVVPSARVPYKSKGKENVEE